jgi:ribonuclease E
LAIIPEAAPVASTEDAAPQQAAPASEPRRRQGEPIASEPRIERVVVTPDQAAAATAETGERPARRGWWQRRLGGE